MKQRESAKKLYRASDGCLGGVCAGLAHRYGYDPIVIRILVLLGALMTLGFGAFIYLALWSALPLEPENGIPLDVSPESVESSAYGCVDYPGDYAQATGKETLSIAIWIVVAICFLLLFVIVVANVSSMIGGSQWWQFWPLGLVICGICLIVVPIKGRFEVLWHAVGVVAVALAVSCLPMTLGVLAWSTFAYAFERMWPLLIAAVVLMVVGTRQKESALTIAGSLAVALFCLIMLVFYAVPGDVAHLLIRMPGGRSIYIAVASSLLSVLA